MLFYLMRVVDSKFCDRSIIFIPAKLIDAFKRYTARKERNITLLSEYAKVLRVEDKVRSYLEVLL